MRRPRAERTQSLCRGPTGWLEEIGLAWLILASCLGLYLRILGGRDRLDVPAFAAALQAWLSGAQRRQIALGEVSAAARLRESAPTRLVVAGSADFVANNIATILNLTDWLVQDESLIAIRSKNISLPAIEPVEPGRARLIKLGNLLGGSLLLLIFGLLRWWSRRPPAAPAAAASTPGAP